MPHQSLLNWLYGTLSGTLVANLLCSRRAFSRLATRWSHSPGSRRRIEPFIRTFDVAMDDYEPETYQSFNDFFIRRLRSGARSFCPTPGRLPAWAEGACLAWERVLGSETFPVKGEHLTAAASDEPSLRVWSENRGGGFVRSRQSGGLPESELYCRVGPGRTALDRECQAGEKL